MFEASPDCAALLDGQGHVLRMNRNGQLLMGLDLAGRGGLPWVTLWPLESRSRVDRCIHEALGGKAARFDSHRAVPGGTSRWWSVTVAPVFQRGAVSHLLALARDTTQEQEARRTQEAAAQSTRERGELFESMGHEIRTRLNAVLGLSHLLTQSAPRPDQRESLDKMREGGRHLRTLLQDLLDLVRAETGTLALNESEFDLKEVVRRVREAVLDATRAKGLALLVDVAGDVPHKLSGDAQRLEQLLLNFAMHAVEASEDGTVQIAMRMAEREADSVVLQVEVRDSAATLPPARVSGFFDSSMLTLPSGFAAPAPNMALCKPLARLMQGEVGVSTTAGEGNTLWFTARMRLGSDAGAQVSVLEGPPEVLLGRRALVADDEPASRDLIRQLLELAGMQVDTANDGKQALEAVRAHHYDAVVLDMVMPHLSGAEATRAIREQLRQHALPVIVLSANPEGGDRMVCAAAGATDCLSKGVDPDELWWALARWMLA